MLRVYEKRLSQRAEIPIRATEPEVTGSNPVGCTLLDAVSRNPLKSYDLWRFFVLDVSRPEHANGDNYGAIEVAGICLGGLVCGNLAGLKPV